MLPFDSQVGGNSFEGKQNRGIYVCSTKAATHIGWWGYSTVALKISMGRHAELPWMFTNK